MSRYRSSGWSSLSLRFVGSLVVFAIAALSGAVMGGVGVYILNDAINPPPPAEASAGSSAPPASIQAKAPGSQSPSAPPQSAPKPVASAAASQAKPPNNSQAATQDAPKSDAMKPDAQQSAPKPSPDAVSRAHPTAASAPAADGAPHGAAAAQADAKSADDASTKNGPARTATDNQTDVARKKAAIAKKRVTVTSARRFTPGASELAQSGSQRSLYDYYDGQQRRSFVQTRQRVIVRRQDNFDDGWGRQADRSAFPVQPRSSYFGFFGRARFNDRNDNW